MIALALCGNAACSESGRAPYAPTPDLDDDDRDGGDQDDRDAFIPDDTIGLGTTTPGQIDMLGQVGADSMDPSKVCSGWDHACAIDRDGKPWCWGVEGGKIHPPDDLPPLVKIACGSQHTCAIGDDQQIYCWGEGQSDDPSMFSATNVGQSAVPPGSYLELAIGQNSLTTCAIDTDDAIVCWGAGDANAPPTSQAYFGQGRPPTTGRYRGLTEGDAHACAINLATDGAVCWGGGGLAGCLPPTSLDCGQTDVLGGPFAQLAAGSYHTCGLTDSGEVLCWGKGLTDDNCSPDTVTEARFDCGQSIPAAPDDTIVAISSGTLHTCAVTERYEGVCWGWNAYGQLNVPAVDFAQLAPGDAFTCGLRTDGKVACWGSSPAVGGAPANFPGVY